MGISSHLTTCFGFVVDKDSLLDKAKELFIGNNDFTLENETYDEFDEETYMEEFQEKLEEISSNKESLINYCSFGNMDADDSDNGLIIYIKGFCFEHYDEYEPIIMENLDKPSFNEKVKFRQELTDHGIPVGNLTWITSAWVG